MNEPLGLGLVGAGAFGAFCLDAYAAMDALKVVAVADVDLARAQAIAPQGAQVYNEYSALLADPAVQVVAINTPPYLHGRMACQAARAGKHIFVEKPLATSMEEAMDAVRAAQAAGVQLGIDYVLRHHPLHQLAVQIVQSGALGAFQHWSLENFATDDNLRPGHWFWDPDRSGGIHVEHGVHFFDLCNHLVGAAPDRVSGCAQRRPDGRIDRVSATVRYGERVLATFYHSFNQIGQIERTTIRLSCARGQIQLDGWIPTTLTLRGLVDAPGLTTCRALLGQALHVREQFPEGTALQHGGAAENIAARIEAQVEEPKRQSAYQRAIQAGMRDLVRAIQEGHPPTVSASDALLSLAVALTASDAGHCGAPLLQIPDGVASTAS